MMGKIVRKMRANIQFWPSYKLTIGVKIVLKSHLNLVISTLGQDFGSRIGVAGLVYDYEGQILKILDVMRSKGE